MSIIMIYLKRRDKMKRISDKILVCVCLILTLGFGFWIYFRPKQDFSVSENRALTKFPSVSVSQIMSGRFSEGLSEFYSDQFPLRQKFTSIKAVSELAQLRRENNGVLLGREGYLVMNPRYGDMSVYEKNLEAVKMFCEKYGGEETEVGVFFAPRGADVLSAYLPSVYSNTDNQRIWKIANEYLPNLLCANREIAESVERGEQVWYKTDHHWTPRGAYECYRAVLERFGDSLMPLTELQYETVSHSFRGSCHSKLGLSHTADDEISLLRYREDERYEIVNHDKGTVSNSFYSLENRDGYEVFLGGNFGHISIKDTQDGGKETLLLIKDSFANCAVPFLADSYDIEMYDLRYFNGRISEEIDRIRPDRILILYGIDTAVTDGSLKELSR